MKKPQTDPKATEIEAYFKGAYEQLAATIDRYNRSKKAQDSLVAHEGVVKAVIRRFYTEQEALFAGVDQQKLIDTLQHYLLMSFAVGFFAGHDSAEALDSGE